MGVSENGLGCSSESVKIVECILGRCYFRIWLDILLCKIGKPNMLRPVLFLVSSDNPRETICAGVMDFDVQVFHFCFCEVGRLPNGVQICVIFISCIDKVVSYMFPPHVAHVARHLICAFNAGPFQGGFGGS